MSSDRNTVWFATQNTGKFDEAKSILKPYGIEVRRLTTPKRELQSTNLRSIAMFAAKSITGKDTRLTLVEDSGLFVDCLNGFPGPYSSYFCSTVGPQGILRLMARARSRRARFRSVIVACQRGMQFKTFTGVAQGVIARRVKGRAGFGFDPVFVPYKQSNTFAEMTQAQKNRLSHRGHSFRKFARWYLSSAN